MTMGERPGVTQGLRTQEEEPGIRFHVPPSLGQALTVPMRLLDWASRGSCSVRVLLPYRCGP